MFMRQYMYSSHVLYLGFTQVIWTHGIAVWQIRYKAYITNSIQSLTGQYKSLYTVTYRTISITLYSHLQDNINHFIQSLTGQYKSLYSHLQDNINHFIQSLTGQHKSLYTVTYRTISITYKVTYRTISITLYSHLGQKKNMCVYGHPTYPNFC
jgi:hypothetical protein